MTYRIIVYGSNVSPENNEVVYFRLLGNKIRVLYYSTVIHDNMNRIKIERLKRNFKIFLVYF